MSEGKSFHFRVESQASRTSFPSLYKAFAMFVVVYFYEAREFLVLPEAWVQELNSAKLKNYGRNANQNFRAYYNTEGGESVRAPNFNTPLVNSLEDVRDEACFMCRVKKFFGA